ncbi:MAG: helix-turn-helix domain-containing protein [Vulcanimicrobiaceae bacterium]
MFDRKKPPRRRRNDGLAPAKGDSLFAAEVKRIARERGYSLRELAQRMGRNHSVVSRAINERRKTRSGTAAECAKALDVPNLYLRLLANRAHFESEDVDVCISGFRDLYAASATRIRSDKYDELWSILVERLPAHVIIEGYLRQTRAAVNAQLGVAEPYDACATLVSLMEQSEVDAQPFLIRTAETALMDLHLMLSGFITNADRDALIGHYRQTLINRGEHTPAMDMHLHGIRSDARYDPEFNLSKTGGLNR